MTTPQPSTAIGTSTSPEIGRVVERNEYLHLERVLAEPVVLERPALRGADTEEAGVLPRAVVVQAASVHGAALEVVLARSCARKELPDRRELLGSGSVRGAGDGDVLLGEVVVGANEEECLDRLRRRPHEGDEPCVAVRLHDAPVGIHPRRVDAVTRLDHPSPGDGYCERIHGRGA